MTNYELFEKYFRDELNSEELKGFQERLREDVSFNKEFQFMKELKYVTKDQTRSELNKLLINAENNFSDNFRFMPNKSLFQKAVLLLVVICVSIIAVYRLNRTSLVDTEELFQKHYVRLTSESVGDQANIDISTIKGEALLAYEANNFILASKKFSRVLVSEKTPENYLLAGVSNLEADNIELAIDQFNIGLNEFDEFDREYLWFMSMAFLKSDLEVEALSCLTRLALENDGPALAILEELNIDYKQKPTLGILENIILQEGSNGPFQRNDQSGTVSDLTTRVKYSYYLATPLRNIEEGALVNYVILKKDNVDRPAGIAYVTATAE